MSEELCLLVGTRKGLFRAVSADGRSRWTLEGPWLEGREVYHAVPDPAAEGVAWAATNHPVWGSHVCRSEDFGRGWTVLERGPAFPADAGRRVEGLWHLRPLAAAGGPRLYAGAQPAALFRSDDEGREWTWLRGLEDAPGRERWRPVPGGLFLHSIQADPRDPGRLYVAVSAGGCYRSDDEGGSWRPINAGVRADYLADPEAPAGHNPHALRVHPLRRERLYRQGYDGVYRSDDAGDSWVEITDGLPSGFGYVVELDPEDPDRAWVVPEEGSHMRCVCEGRLRVYETSDAGATWTARTAGLPQRHAYVSVLREAMCVDPLRPPGVHFGTSTGHLFATGGRGRWTRVAGYLPTILSVSCVRLPASS